MMSTRTRPDVEANRNRYRVTKVTVGQKLWLEWDKEQNLIAVRVTEVGGEVGHQSAIVKDADGWDYVVYNPLGMLDLFTHWFRLF